MKHMKHTSNIKTITAGGLIAGALTVAAVGLGSGVANADPWGPGRGHDHWGPGYGAPNWGPPPPPPPPPPYYGYGAGYGGPACVTGPLGFLHFCA